MTDADKGALQLQTAVTAATQQVASTAGLSTTVITPATQLAYTALKASQ